MTGDWFPTTIQTWPNTSGSWGNWPISISTFGSNTMNASNVTISDITTYMQPSDHFYSLPEVRLIIEQIRKWAEEFCKNSTYFDVSLKGFSGLASRQIFKTLLHKVPSIKLAYTPPNNNAVGHIFCLLKLDSESTGEYIIDIAANVYNEPSIVVEPINNADLNTKLWWKYETTYNSDVSLIKRQRKDKWPEFQITQYNAKKSTLIYKLVKIGSSDIDNGIIKILPFDDAALKFLTKQAKNDGIKSNVAELLLRCSKHELELLFPILNNLL